MTPNNQSQPIIRPEAGRHSDKGPRAHNEDHSWIPEHNRQILAHKGYLYIVADGVGGQAAGEVASRMAVQLVSQFYYDDPETDVKLSLSGAIKRANQQIHQHAAENADQHGMASTITAVVIQNNHAFIANVGDSRTYLVRNGQVKQLTVDHTWVNRQVQAGILTSEEARHHKRKNIVTRSLGSSPQVEVDVFGPRSLSPEDYLILCSDGLSEVVTDSDLVEFTAKNLLAKQIAHNLVQLALSRETRDNVTCVVVYLPHPTNSAARTLVGATKIFNISTPAEETQPAKRTMGLVLVGLVIVLACLGLGLFWMSQQPAATSTPIALSGSATPTSNPTDITPLATTISIVTSTTQIATSSTSPIPGPTPTEAQLDTSVRQRPQLMRPVDSQSFQPNRPIHLNWGLGTPLVAGEHFWVAVNSQTGRPVTEEKWMTTETEFEIPINLPPGNYRWIVIVENEDAQILARSDARQFTITTLNSPQTPPPTPEIVTPPPVLAGRLTLEPIEETVQGPVSFSWRYDGQLAANQGFEIRVWREGDPPQGIHNALEDNKTGLIEPLGNKKYRLIADISGTPAVQNRVGNYWWSVFLIQIDPAYDDLNVSATPDELTFSLPGNDTGQGGGEDNPGDGTPIPTREGE